MNLQNQNSKSKELTTLFAMLCFVLMGQAATADSLTAPSGVDAASEIQTYGKYFDNAPDVAVSFQQGEYLMVKTSSKSGISVAEVVEQGEDVYLRELRWADDFHDPALDGDLGRVLYEFEDVPVKQIDGSVSGRDLEIVEAVGSKGIFVREVGSFSWVDDLTGNGWDNNLRTLLKSDLETNPSLFDNVGNLAGVDAWKILYDAGRSQLRTNPAVLEKVSDILNKSDIDGFVSKIKHPEASTPKFTSKEEFLESFCQKHSEWPAGYQSLETELENLDHFIDNYKNVNGAGEYMEEMLQSGSKFKGGSYGISLLKNNLDELAENGKYILDGFEEGIDGITTGHRYDFRFKEVNDPTKIKMIETKNWSSVQQISGSTYQQFLAYVSSNQKFEYWFRNLGIEMKSSFQDLMGNYNKVEELWNANSTFFTSKGFASLQEVVDAANADQLINNPLLNFIKG